MTACYEEARAAAHSAEATPSDRPFHGVPLSIKDMTDTAGVRTTYSSRAFASYVPDRDVAVVRRLREAGFILRFTPFTCVANVTGLPALSLPLGSSDGLPVGVQLIGPPAGDALLIRLAAQIEEARPWRDRRPGVS